jgi:transcription elongation factor GreA
VTIGSTVTVDGPDGERIAMTIVGSAEADPAAGRISNASPVGRALLGHVVGDTIVVITPRGEASYQVVAID